MADGPVSLKNLTKCEEVRKGADQANYSLYVLRRGKYGNRLDMNRPLLNSEDQKGCTSKIEFLTKITINPCSTRT